MSDKINIPYQADSRRAAKNTLMMYFQMLFSMLVGLYTSRVILQVLGISDYGLQNVVSGVVTLFTFFNGTLISGTQRFMSYAIGTGDIQKAKNVFSATLTIHLFMAVLVCIVTEIGGLYLMYKKMQIPDGRMDAALWLFHMSIVSLFVSISQVPFNAAIVAHEKLSAFAFLASFDVVFRLLIVFIIQLVDGVDKLILYATLGFIASLINIVINRWMCIRWFEEARFHFGWDKKLYKDILGFSGWNLIGCIAVTGSNEGFNVLLNMFFGTIVNAARGIAIQLSGFTTKFVSGFTSAISPQIVKSYAAGNTNEMWRLAKMSSLYSAFLVIIFAIPIWVEADVVLYLWLGQVPEHTVFFSRVVIIQTLIFTMSRPLVTCIHAIGEMKWYSLTNGLFLLLILPSSYLFVRLGLSVETIYILNVIPWLVEWFFCMFFIYKYSGVDTIEFIKELVPKVVVIVLAGGLPSWLLRLLINNLYIEFLAVGSVSSAITLFLIYFWGVDSVTKQKISKIVNSMIGKKFTSLR